MKINATEHEKHPISMSKESEQTNVRKIHLRNNVKITQFQYLGNVSKRKSERHTTALSRELNQNMMSEGGSSIVLERETQGDSTDRNMYRNGETIRAILQ